MQQGGCESLLLGGAPILPCYSKSSGCGSGSILDYCSTKIRFSHENDNRGLELVFLYTLEKRVTSTVPSLSSFKWVLLLKIKCLGFGIAYSKEALLMFVRNKAFQTSAVFSLFEQHLSAAMIILNVIAKEHEWALWQVHKVDEFIL